jgi:hypothetical protein
MWLNGSRPFSRDEGKATRGAVLGSGSDLRNQLVRATQITFAMDSWDESQRLEVNPILEKVQRKMRRTQNSVRRRACSSNSMAIDTRKQLQAVDLFQLH